jgi:hypothetical protein
MPAAAALGLDIIGVVRIDRQVVGHSLHDRDSFRFQTFHLGRIVGQQPHLLRSKRPKHGCRGGIVALVIGEAQPAIGIDRVEPAILQCIGTDLVRQPDSAPLLAEIEQDSPAGIRRPSRCAYASSVLAL